MHIMFLHYLKSTDTRTIYGGKELHPISIKYCKYNQSQEIIGGLDGGGGVPNSVFNKKNRGYS